MRAFLLFALLIICTTISAAGRVVTGVVIDADTHEALIGVTVFVPTEDLKKIGINTPVGVSTDMDGKFSIQIPEKVNQINLTYLGYEKKIVPLTGESSYKISMSPASHVLGDVVVTGYQEIERRKLTASISKIDLSDEKVGSLQTLDQALMGQISGVTGMVTSGQPGAPVKLRIRGTSSMNGTQDPLWVLDGLPLEGTEIPRMNDLKDIDDIYTTAIGGINPNDIESITVLKDAAATAIYGARAANGVIVITTKKGRQGKSRVSFSTRMTYGLKPNIDRLNLMNSDEKIQLELDLLRSNYTYRENKGGAYRTLNKYGQVNAYKAGGWDALSAATQAEINALRGTNTDWNDILFRSTFNQEYNVSVSGGGDKATYYTSLGFYDEKGNVTSVGTNRFNVTTKIQYKFSDKFKAGASVFANRRKSTTYLADHNGITNATRYSRIANPYQSIYDANGNYIYDTDIQYFNGDATLDFNIFEERNNTTNETVSKSIFAIFDLEYRPIEDLKLYTQIGIQSDDKTFTKIALKDSYAMRVEHQRATIMNSSGEYNSFLPNGGVHKQNEGKFDQITWKGQAEYRKVLNSTHEFEVMVGSELRRTWSKNHVTAGYGYDGKTLTTKPIGFPEGKAEEFGRIFPQYGLTNIENAFVSAFSTFSYTFDRRFTLGGSVRFDGSDLFGVKNSSRYTPLYSVSGLWRISSESFMKNVKWIDDLGLRASYGVQGNLDKGTSHFLQGKYFVDNVLPNNNEYYIDVTSLPNPKLKWETTTNINLGIDLSILRDAISVTANYYKRMSRNLIGTKHLPLESGFGQTNVNWAKMDNEGFEVSLTSRNIQTKSFSWFTNFNLGYNKNTVRRETLADNSILPSREGYSVDPIFALPYAGLDSEGYPLFYNKEGEKVTAKELFKLEQQGNSATIGISTEERRALYRHMGSMVAPYSGGLMNTFRYKAFELGINCIFNWGHYVKTEAPYSITGYDRGLNASKDILNRWTSDNTNTKFPALISNDKRVAEYNFFSDFGYDNSLDYLVRKGDYIRLQNIRFGYNLPQSVLKLLSLSSATVAVEGRNLFVIGDYKGYLDPETMGNMYSQPVAKSFVFSLNVNL